MINNFVKNRLKYILIVGVTAIICISGTVFATGYLAKDINYTKEGSDVKNVEEALNELYSKTTTNNTWVDVTDQVQITGLNNEATYSLLKCGNVIKLQIAGRYANGTTKTKIGELLKNDWKPSEEISTRICGSDNYYGFLSVDENGNIYVKQAISSGYWMGGDITWICGGN